MLQRLKSGVTFKTLLLLIVLFLLATPVEAKTSVRLGQVVSTEAAILCIDVEPAKFLADLTDAAEIEMVGQQFIAARICGIAGGSMTVESLMYEGKTYNVFKTRDSSRTFYWVTVVKPEYD